MRNGRRILIVGGGIAGQTLAPALKKRGIDCEIVEIKPDWQIIGAGMYIQGNGLRALQDIGVVEEIVRCGWHNPDDTTAIADMQGAVLARPHIPRIAGAETPPLVAIQRRVLHDVLQGAVTRTGIEVRMGVTVDSIIDDPSEPSVRVRFSDGSAGEFDLVVGADGIRSKVRTLAIGALDPIFTGFSNWRVILPKPRALECIVWMYGKETSVGLVPLSEETMYIAGVTKEPGNPRYANELLPRLMREKFAAYRGLVPLFLEQVRDPDQVVYTAIEEILMPPPWHKGRVVVLGDAAHASTPFWAQGASMAIEDCIVLAELLTGSGSVTDMLAEWMKRRHERCLYVQRGSMEAGMRIHERDESPVPVSAEMLASRIQADVDARYGRLAEPI